MTTMSRARHVTINPFGRFAGTKAELLQAAEAILSWDYRRASKDDHKLAKSVDDQATDNARQEERLGWTHAKSFQDNDLGASRQAKRRGVVREEFENLLAAIRNGEPGDVLIMWELSRRERDLAVFVRVRDLCIEYGPYFWLVGGELYDVRNRHDRSYLGSQAQQAESGADAIEEGVRRGLAANAEQGKPHGPTPFGYRRVYHPRTRKYVEQVPDWDTSFIDIEGKRVARSDANGRPWSPAGVVTEMYEDALAVVPLNAIATALNRRGIPTPRLLASIEHSTPKGPERWSAMQWTAHLIRQLLLNQTNIGVRMSHGEVTATECWPELVVPELFYALTHAFTEPSRRTNPYVGVRNRAKYLNSRVARCWVCKDFMLHHKGRGTEVHRYQCTHSCSAIPLQLLDETVEDAVIYRLANPGELSALLALDSNAPEIRAARAEVERLQVDLADTKARIRIAEREDMNDLEARRGWQRRKLAAAQAAMTSTDLPRELVQFLGTTAAEALTLWRGFSLPVQRAIIRAAINPRRRIASLCVGRSVRSCSEPPAYRAVSTTASRTTPASPRESQPTSAARRSAERALRALRSLTRASRTSTRA
jgi:site-specific DNA recombinase